MAMICPKCAGEMKEGFMVSRSLDYSKPDEWVEGAPEASLWFGTKVRSKQHLQIASFRCERCGYLESYAREAG